jgi:hypothetical protein
MMEQNFGISRNNITINGTNSRVMKEQNFMTRRNRKVGSHGTT